MKIVTCASYYGTGSSAITDLLSEYKGVKSLGDYEFTFLHDLDGVSDLEHHLVACPNRHGSGHALKRFERVSRFYSGKWYNKRYEPYFNNQYWKLTQEYISDILEFKIKGYRFADLYDRGLVYYYVQSVLGKILKIMHVSLNLMPQSYLYYSQPTEGQFLEATRKYTRALLNAANKDDADYLMVDQLLPSSNINRCLRYLDNNVFVFLVDRDPRDVFLLNKYFWHVRQVPFEVDDFCKWFEYTHRAGKKEVWDEQKVRKICFEDLIYKYSETVQLIESFTGLSSKEHLEPFSKMNPKRSVVNTRVWERVGKSADIKYIESNLKDYLYNYSGISLDVIEGKEVNSTDVF